LPARSMRPVKSVNRSNYSATTAEELEQRARRRHNHKAEKPTRRGRWGEKEGEERQRSRTETRAKDRRDRKCMSFPLVASKFY